MRMDWKIGSFCSTGSVFLPGFGKTGLRLSTEAVVTPDDIRFFDAHESYSVSWNKLPHWSQAGTLAFVTWRTADSIPKPVYLEFVSRRNKLLIDEGIDPSGDWQAALKLRKPAEALQVKWKLIEEFETLLNGCHGACVLERPEIAAIVEGSLRKFDGERYVLTDFIVMPNHVHLLAAFASEELMPEQITGWKRFQARQINQQLGTAGPFWQDRCFDHLVRSEAQFEYYRRYIANNGVDAGLHVSQYLHWSREL